MKKLFILCTGLLCLFSTHVSAQTEQMKTKPFAGIELTQSTFGMTDGFDTLAEDTLTGFSITGGVKINDIVSLSAFYQFSGEKSKSASTIYGYVDTTSSFKAFGVDLTGYLSVKENFNLFGSVGLGKYDVDFEQSLSGYEETWTEKHTGIRFGLGAEYFLKDNISLTANARYVDFDYDSDEDYIEDMTEIGIGVRYYF